MRSTFSVAFYLKKSTNSIGKRMPIMGRISINNKRVQFSTHESVELAGWGVKANQVRGRSYDSHRINQKLNDIRGRIINHYNMLRLKDVDVTAEAIRNAYFGLDDDHKKLLDVYSGFVEKYKNRVGIDRNITTWRRYKKSIDHLNVFIRKEYKESDILLNKLTESFIDDYLIFLRHDMDLKPMTVKGYIYCLKNVIYVAFNNGWMRTNPFASFKYSPTPPEKMPVDENELQKIMAVKLQHKAQERTRDMFVFSCFTGISYMDKSLKIIATRSGVEKHLTFHRHIILSPRRSLYRMESPWKH